MIGQGVKGRYRHTFFVQETDDFGDKALTFFVSDSAIEGYCHEGFEFDVVFFK